MVEKMSRLNERARIVLTAILLCLALGATIFFGIQAVQAIKRFEQSRALAQRYNRPLDNLIRDVQDAILAYRKQHPHRTPPGGHTNAPTLQERKKT